MDNGTSKRCASCAITKVHEAFTATRTRRDGLEPYCRECRSQKARERREANLEEHRAKGREQSRRWIAENPDRQRAILQRHYAKVTPEELARRRVQNRDSKYAALIRRRAIKLGVRVVERFSRQDIIDRDGRLCYLCGKLCEDDASLDHVIPLTRGGEHSMANARIACLSCNHKKHNMTLEEYMERRNDARFPSGTRRHPRKMGFNPAPIQRAAIIARDKSTCQLCSLVLADDQIHLDHVVPISRGGTHTEDNIQVTCGPCNRHKSDRLLSEL